MIRETVRVLFTLVPILGLSGEAGAVEVSPSLDRAGAATTRSPVAKQSRLNTPNSIEADESDRFESDRQAGADRSAKMSGASSSSSSKNLRQRRQTDCRRPKYPEDRFVTSKTPPVSRCDERPER